MDVDALIEPYWFKVFVTIDGIFGLFLAITFSICDKKKKEDDIDGMCNYLRVTFGF